MYLHGNRIAWIYNGDLYICMCGWNTLTTRERLNALNGVHIVQRAGRLYLNGEEINDHEVYKINC